MPKYGEWSFDPIGETGIIVPKKKRQEALEEVAEFVKEQTLQRTGEGRTSVKGGRWVKGLTPEYKKKKAEESSVDFANLELQGEMLDSLNTGVRGKKVFIEVGEDQRGKAEGHLTGKYGKHSSIRPRQFMPVGDQELAPEIMAGVRKILKRYEEK